MSYHRTCLGIEIYVSEGCGGNKILGFRISTILICIDVNDYRHAVSNDSRRQTKKKSPWFFLWRETSDEKMMFGPCFVFYS